MLLAVIYYDLLGLPCGLGGKESSCNEGDLGLIPGSGRSPGGGNVNLLQYSCLENYMDRGVWQATVHGVTKSDEHSLFVLVTNTHAYTHTLWLIMVTVIQTYKFPYFEAVLQGLGCGLCPPPKAPGLLIQLIQLSPRPLLPWHLPRVRSAKANRKGQRRSCIHQLLLCTKIITKMQGFKMKTVSLIHGLLFWAGSADLCWILLRHVLSPGRVAGGLMGWDVHSHVWKLVGYWSGIGWLLAEALSFQQASCIFFTQLFQGCKDGKIRSYENFKKIFIYLAAPGLSYGMQNLQFPNQGSNLGPLHWEGGVLATGTHQGTTCQYKNFPSLSMEITHSFGQTQFLMEDSWLLRICGY